MKTEILLAITDSDWELALGRAISENSLLKIGRRCVDLTEVLTMLEVNEFKIAVISSEVQHLDYEVLTAIKNKDCLTVGVFTEGDLAGASEFTQLGIEKVISFSPNDPAGFIANLVFCANEKLGLGIDESKASFIPGLIAVWGTAGSPGRTALSIDIATNLNQPQQPCLLIDADVQAPAVAASLGITEEISGISAAIHQAQIGKLNKSTLFECIKQDSKKISVLTGILKPDRWIEVRVNGLERLLNFASEQFAHQVIDLGANLPDAQDATYREFESSLKFGHSKSVLQLAEKVVFVVKANPLGIIRAAEILQNQDIFSPDKLLVVVNGINDYSFGKNGTKLIEDVLHRFIPANRIWYHPEELNAYSRAWLRGVSGYSLMSDQSKIESLFSHFSSRRIDFHAPATEVIIKSVA